MEHLKVNNYYINDEYGQIRIFKLLSKPTRPEISQSRTYTAKAFNILIKKNISSVEIFSLDTFYLYPENIYIPAQSEYFQEAIKNIFTFNHISFKGII